MEDESKAIKEIYVLINALDRNPNHFPWASYMERKKKMRLEARKQKEKEEIDGTTEI